MNEEARIGQAKRLSIEINEAIRLYARDQLKAGTAILANDIVAALTCSIARMIANLPDDLLQEIHREIGKTLLISVRMHRQEGEGAPISPFIEDEERTVQ
jgi:hypothetical protein